MRETITSSPLTLEGAGFSVPDGTFSLQRAVFAALNEFSEKNNTSPSVTFHRGQPPISPGLSSQQYRDILGLKEEELSTLEGVAKDVAVWVKDTLIPEIAPYADDGKFKEFVRNTFAPTLSLDQSTVVYGDEKRAVDLIHQVMSTSVRNKAALLKRTYPSVSPKNETLLRTGIESELDNQNFVHIVVHDSQRLTQEQKEWIKSRLRGGHCFVTDVITSGFNAQKSLATDTDIADLVFTVDATTPTQLYGIGTIFGNDKVIGAIQRLHEETIGTLPSSAMEMRRLLSTAEFRAQLLSLTSDEIANISTHNKSLAQVIAILKSYALLEYGTDDKEKSSIQNNLQKFIRHAETWVQQQIKEYYFPSLLNELAPQMVVASGGARGLLSATEKFFVDKSELDTIAVLSPHWPYSDTFKNAKIVSLDDCFKANGDIDIELLRQKLDPLGKKVALIVESGGRFPDGNVHSDDTKKKMIQLGADLGIQLWDDAMFHRIVFDENDSHSFLEIAHAMQSKGEIGAEYLKKITTFWTGSKHLGLAGLHMGAVISSRNDLIEHLTAVSPKPDALALHIGQMLTEKDTLDMRETMLLEELNRRMNAVDTSVEERKTVATVTRPKGAYYSELRINSPNIQQLTKHQMEQLILHLARKYGIGILPMSYYFPNQDGAVDPTFLIKGNVPADEMRQQILTLIDTIVSLTAEELAAVKNGTLVVTSN